jgi:integrase
MTIEQDDDFVPLIRQTLRACGKADSTIENYSNWWIRFRAHSRANGTLKTAPEPRVTAWLTDLAVKGRVSASTQNQAMQAICTICKLVFHRPLVGIDAYRPKRTKAVKSVISPERVFDVISQCRGVARKAAYLMYASGLRVGEVVKLRIKDLDFDRRTITIHEGKHNRDRLTQFPIEIHELIRSQIESTRCLWRLDQEENANGVSLPHAYGRKCPRAHREFAWYYLFSADRYSRCPHTGKLFRHHRDKNHLSREISAAVARTGLPVQFTAHNFRHCYATHFLDSNNAASALKSLQTLMGHESLETTETYLHASTSGPTNLVSPLAAFLSSAQPKRDNAMRIVG